MRFASEPMSFGPGIRGAFFFDPDGNGFGLAELDIVTRRLEEERQQAAARAEAERRAEFELGIAAQIQAGLFPRHRPPVATLDYTGVCIQAQQVGGDYFDFLGAESQRLGLVVGDVSGKGIGAALLMASLQATFRNQYAHYASDLPALLTSVNEMFLANSPAPSYVSLFLASYDDTTRQLQFVNCGHPPPVLLRATGEVEMLEATAGVLGMFEQWTGHVRTVQLHPGDTIAIYTDGVTEASGPDDVEFGVARLIDALRTSAGGSVKEQQDAVIAAVRRFGAGASADDITLLLARCLS